MTGKSIPILTYHEVNVSVQGFNKCNRMDPATCLSVEEFSDQMSYLSQNKFSTISLKNVLEGRDDLSDFSCNNRRIAITFDDGHIGNFKFVLPILKKYGFSTTFFIATDFIGKENMMSWSDLEEMVKEGMEVQSHAISHKPLSLLTNEQLVDELSGSKKTLEHNLGVKVDFLSLPHGDYDRRIGLIAKDVGYQAIFTSEPKYFLKNKQRNNFLIGRIEIKKGCSSNYYISIVNGKFDKIMCLRLTYKLKSILRSFIGVENYRRLYRLFNGIKVN